MLFLLIQLGNERYALDTAQVVEVLPLVDIRIIPQSPPEIAGIIDYRGAPMPVIDLSRLLLHRQASAQLSTRILVTHYLDEEGATHLLGLIAENATGMTRRDPSEFVPPGVSSSETSYLGPVATDSTGGILQWIHAARLLSAAVRGQLFRRMTES